jgi:HD-GYP domain-containing protein (c-di-GMP phosphodiesterase class II)
MLSDRPYRKALPLSVVVEQLQEHAGRQFDHRVVRALVQSDILQDYARTMQASREQQAAERTAEAIPSVPSLKAPAARTKPASASYYH